jgi:C4-dicarboxylate-specific signal transduction histidine kinase
MRRAPNISRRPPADTGRLATVGMLAAGLGHDIGNLLPVVGIRLDSLKQMDLPPEALEDIAAISNACEYLQHLCRGLRLFVIEPDGPRPTGGQTDLMAWWTDVGPFMRNALPRGVQLRVSPLHELPPVAISPVAITQVLYNLLQNAGDAMSGRPAGRVSISAFISSNADHVVLEVTDDGPGMPPEVLRHCMEPFFTTKARGVSSGLGLALVTRAMHDAGGTVAIRSHARVGTTFALTLPVATSLCGAPTTFSSKESHA